MVIQNKAPAQQFCFSSGILDDAVQARQDLKVYFSGAKELTNVICQTIGGVTLRGGLKTYMEVPEAVNGCRLAKFEIDAERGYLGVFLDKKVKILKDKELKQELETPYTGSNLLHLDFNQSMDTTVITSPNYPLKKLVFNGQDNNWILADIEIDTSPKATFIDTEGGQNEIQRLKFASAGAGNSFRLKLEGYKTQSIVWTGTAATNAQNIRDALNKLEIIDAERGGVKVTIIDGEYDVEFIGTDGKKSFEDIIISIEDASDQCRVYTKCIKEGKPPLETLWSEKRGWPISSFFYQGRCFFGGSKSKENIICGSMANQAFAFRTSEENLDDEAIIFSADAEGSAHIARIYGLEKLFIFTDKGVFVVPDSPMTPSSYAVPHTDIPCAKIRPVAIDGDVVYVTRSPDGKNQSVGSVTYNYENEKYRTDDLATFAYSVMREPLSIDVRRGTRRNNATYLFVVNADGTLAVLNTKKSQELNGWTLCNTKDGKIKDVCVVNDTPFFWVERKIKGETRYFIEYWDDSAKFDLSIELTSAQPKTLWNNVELAFYEGLEVGIYADGLAYGTETVVDGQIELDYAVSKIEIGLPFDWVIETMPVVAELTDGTLIGHRHRLPLVTLRLQDSAGINIGKQTLCSRFFGRQNNFNRKEVLMNGTFKVRQLGYFGANRDRLATVRLSGSSLQPMTLLSITTEVVQ